MRQFRGSVGLIDPRTGAALATTLWGYDGQYPGPTFEVRPGEPVTVRWTNALAADGRALPHLLRGRSFDPHRAYPRWPAKRRHLVTHLHGGHVESASDGDPEAWFTPGFAERGPAFAKEVYRYDNDQQAGTLWYHDHALGLTRLNVGAGLAGLYLVRDDDEVARATGPATTSSPSSSRTGRSLRSGSCSSTPIPSSTVRRRRASSQKSSAPRFSSTA